MNLFLVHKFHAKLASFHQLLFIYKYSKLNYVWIVLRYACVHAWHKMFMDNTLDKSIEHAYRENIYCWEPFLEPKTSRKVWMLQIPTMVWSLFEALHK